MTEVGLEGHSMSSEDDLPADIGRASSTVVKPCLDLLHVVAELAARKRALDVEQFEITDEAYLDDALDDFWVTRRSCDLLAIVVRKTQPTTGDEEVIRCKALVAYSTLDNPDDAAWTSLSEFSALAIRAMYPTLVSRSPGSYCCDD